MISPWCPEMASRGLFRASIVKPLLAVRQQGRAVEPRQGQTAAAARTDRSRYAGSVTAQVGGRPDIDGILSRQ